MFSSLSSPFSLSLSKPHLHPPLRHRLPPFFHRTNLTLFAINRDGKHYPNPADIDPPEAPEDTVHGVSKFKQLDLRIARARKAQDAQYEKDQSIFLKAIQDVEDAPDESASTANDDSEGDLYSEIDDSIALKRKEFVKKGLLKPNPKKDESKEEIKDEVADELQPQEEDDLDEIDELEELKGVGEDSEAENSDLDIDDDLGPGNSSVKSEFESEFDAFRKGEVRIVEPKCKMTLAELLDESKVVPVSVLGNLEIEITGIQHDSRLVEPGDLFVCCVGKKTDGHLFLTEALFIAQGNQDVPVVTFALEDKKADVHPLQFDLSLFETQVLVDTPKGILEISSGLLGRQNIYNILAAVAVGIAVEAPLEDIVRGIEEVDVVPGRCELIDEEQTYGVVVDYANTPDGLSRLLDNVRELNPKRIITVIGCPGETERGKRPVMTKIATDKSDVTMLTSDNPRNEDPLDILDDMLAGIGLTMQDYLKHQADDYHPPLANGHRLFLHDIRRVAVRSAVAMGEEGDIVVVTGKGHETYDTVGDTTEFFDDREECREALQYVDELHQSGIDTSEFPWRLPESY
ncbi:putative acid--amino-acid ligase (peptide synthase) [Helianthus annuus]|nr:putative acid--amino-acid ligase (peptide synthase) [Helianthus annuus]